MVEIQVSYFLNVVSDAWGEAPWKIQVSCCLEVLDIIVLFPYSDIYYSFSDNWFLTNCFEPYLASWESMWLLKK